MGFFNTSGSGLDSYKKFYCEAINYLCSVSDKTDSLLSCFGVDIKNHLYNISGRGYFVQFSNLRLSNIKKKLNIDWIIRVELRLLEEMDDGNIVEIVEFVEPYYDGTSNRAIYSIDINPIYLEWFKNNGYGLL